MDYPPWLPTPELSRGGMLLALARCVYEIWCRPEADAEMGKIVTFDNRCFGDLERVAVVLQQTGFTRYIDDIGRRSVFNAGPNDFDKLAYAAKGSSVSDEEIEETVVKLAEGSCRTNLEIRKLAEMIATRSKSETRST